MLIHFHLKKLDLVKVPELIPEAELVHIFYIHALTNYKNLVTNKNLLKNPNHL